MLQEEYYIQIKNYLKNKKNLFAYKYLITHGKIKLYRF